MLFLNNNLKKHSSVKSLFLESRGSTWHKVYVCVCESITLASFSIICQHCHREIKRSQFPLQMHSLNLLLSPCLSETHTSRERLCDVSVLRLLHEATFLQVQANTKRSSKIWGSWILKPETQIHLIYVLTLLVHLCRHCYYKNYQLVGWLYSEIFSACVKMPWFCNRTQWECICLFLGGCGVSWLLSVFVLSYLERR